MIYSTDHGLPANTIYNLLEDDQGYLWFSTINGLSRFDGIRFETYHMPPDSADHPPIKNIRKVISGPDNELFAITNSGTFVFNITNQQFIKTDIDLPPTSTDQLKYNYKVHNGSLIFIDQDSSVVLTGSDYQRRLVLTDSIVSLNIIGDSLWMAGLDKLVLRHANNELKFIPLFFENPEKTSMVSLFPRESSSSVWLVRTLHNAESELYQLNIRQNSLIRFNTETLPEIYSVLEDDFGRIWILTHFNGLFTSDERSKSFHQVEHLGDFVSFSMYLHNDFLWICGNGMGLYKIDIRPPRFNTIPSDARFGEMEIGKLTKKIFARGPEVWFLHTMSNPTKLKYLNLETGDGRDYVFQHEGVHIPVIDFQTPDGQAFWMGTSNFEYYFHTNIYEHSNIFFDKPVPDTRATGFFTSHNNLLWAHSYRHIIAHDLISETRHVIPIPSDHSEEGYGGWQSQGIVDTLANVLWFCFLDKLGKLDLETFAISLLDIPEANTEKVKHIEQVDGKLWIAMESGLLFLDPVSGSRRFFSEKDGLPDSFIYGILKDQNNTLWMGTNRGLSRATIRYIGETPDLTFRNYTIKDGLPSNEFNSYAYFKDETTGRFWFGGTGGLSWFYPEKITDEQRTPRVVIDELRYFNTKVEPDTAIQFKKHLVIPYHQRDVSLHLTGIFHRRPDEISYAWQLFGQDNDWFYSNQERTARYTNLRPGDYTFMTKAANYDGIWGEPTMLGITVTKPFWMQRWFKVLVLLVLTGITIGLTRLVTMRNIRQEQRKLEVQKRIFAERERIARDLHDNVGAQISNIITGIEMYSLKQKTGSDDDPKLFYENIDLEARSAMTELRETIWLMDHTSLKLEDFVRQVRAYLAKTNSLSPDMAYRVLSEGNNQRELSSSLSMHLFRVIQEACNNTRKHAQARHFYVLFRLIKDNLKVIIEDDGKGIDLQSLPENGNGLKNMRNRMQEFSASFEISSKPGKGTRIEIILQIIP